MPYSVFAISMLQVMNTWVYFCWRCGSVCCYGHPHNDDTQIDINEISLLPMMCANNWDHYGLNVILFWLHITLSHYHQTYPKALIYKMFGQYILCSICQWYNFLNFISCNICAVCFQLHNLSFFMAVLRLICMIHLKVLLAKITRELWSQWLELRCSSVNQPEF